MRRYSYRAFGLGIASDLRLQELPSAAIESSSIDLRIESVDQVVSTMPPEAEGGFCRLQDGSFVFRAPGIADFLVEDGRLIRMALAQHADPRLAKLYLLGSALGMALHQRGL